MYFFITYVDNFKTTFIKRNKTRMNLNIHIVLTINLYYIHFEVINII
jgi:hypothetical protein